MQEQDKNKDNINSKKNEEIKIVIDETGSITENLCKPNFGYLLLGIFGVTVAILLGIVAVIKILDATQKIPKILTNKYGVVINSEPKKQVCYFLLNSSQLWAETGIQVEEGDLVSVYASGAINTAIHHVVHAADNDTLPDFDWSGPGGVTKKISYNEQPADYIALKYMVQPSANQSALLMMVADRNGYENYTTDTARSHTYFRNDIITIGEGKAKIRINQNGLLYFCVNEVYLSKKNIENLRNDYIDYIFNKDGRDIVQAGKRMDNKIEKEFGCYSAQIKHKALSNDTVTQQELAQIYTKNLEYLKEDIKKAVTNKNTSTLTTEQQKYLRVFHRIFELEKYYYLGYTVPWYDDNLGSYLVVVEIEKAN